MLRDFVDGRSARALFLFSHFVASDQAAQVLVAGSTFHEERKANGPGRELVWNPGRKSGLIAKIGTGNFRADMSANAQLVGCQMKAR